MDWDKLRVFHTVAQAGSFTRAADQLNLSQSAISRQISGLEDTLGCPLFYRHTRGLVFTEQGDLLFEAVKEVFVKLELTEAVISESQHSPQGALKVTTSVAFGSLWLAPRLPLFLERYPKISVKMILSDTNLDLNNREADVSITLEPPNSLGLLATPLPPYKMRLYASRSYLEKEGTPVKAQDLDHHRLIVFGDDVRHVNSKANWLLHVGGRRGHVRKPYLVINNMQAILSAVKNHLGIAVLHRYIVQDDPDLVEILTDLPGAMLQRYIVHPQQLSASKRTQAFKSFVEEIALRDSDSF